MEQNTSTPSSHSQTQSDSPDQQHIRLACQACQRKKIKCDRLFPCGQCTRSALHCVPSTRKPRARHAGKRAVDSELRNRISKLESLVESLSGEVGAGDGTPGSEDEADEDEDDAQNADSKPNQRQSSSGNVGKYMSSNFWSSLTDEVQALREALEEEPPEDFDTPTSPSSSSGLQNSGEYDLIICPPGSVYVMSGALAEPRPQLSATLCNIFCEYVDRLFKVFHIPTLRAHVTEGKPYLGHDLSSPASKAVRTVVWFAAVNTMSETQCQMVLGQSRPDSLHQYKRLVDVALSQCDVMATSDFATLQAFTVYIAALRASEGSRRVWTLTALAVRMARSIGLDHETVPRSTFMTELRRRLWHYVRFLDIYAALDRGTEILIANGSHDTPLAKNTNDNEFDESSTIIPEHEGLTDMTYPQLLYDAIYYTYGLTVPRNKNSTEETWQSRLQVAQNFEEKIRKKYWEYCNRSDPFQRLILNVSRSMVNAMKLRAVRPLHTHATTSPPRVDSPYVLEIAVNNLRASEAIASDSETAQYRWMVWVQWHALAVALAGLCSIRDTKLANEAWVHVEQAYARNIAVVADQRNGMLWRPIEKLYKKATAYRDHGRTLSISKDFSPLDPQIPALANSYPPNIPTQAGMAPSSSRAAAAFPSQQQLPTATADTTTLQHLSLNTTQPQTQSLNHNSLPAGSMPTAGVMNSSMDIGSLDSTMMGTNDMTTSPTLANWNDVGNGDMSWMDFERLLEDLANPGQAMGMGMNNMAGVGDGGMFAWPTQ